MSGGADEPLMGRCAWARIEKGQALWKNHISCTAEPSHGGGCMWRLAEYFNIDATLIRALFLLLAVFGGSGLLIYIVMWIIVPDVNKA